jgi:glycosyltransferase involved in cell wall biosynthesis
MKNTKGRNGIIYGLHASLIVNLRNEMYLVASVSSIRNKVFRMIHTLLHLCFKSKHYHIIMLQSFGLLAFVMEDVVSRLAIILNKPISFTLHGGAFYDFYLKYPMWVKKVLSRASIITTPSQYLINKLSVLNLDIKYIPNFIDFTNFTFKRSVKNKYSVLWVRAFHDIYHPELAIETIQILKEEFPEVKLTMVGPDQGLLASCNTLIKSLDLEKNIELVGYVNNTKLQEYYHTNQVFITTTRYESFGVSIIEAGACGIPCVSTSVGEIPIIWTNKENILLAERNPTDFAQKISWLFNDDKMYDKISKNAHLNAAKYGWENVKPMWEEVIQELYKKIK